MPDLDEQEDDFLDHFPLCPDDMSFAAFLVEVAEGEVSE